MIDDPETSVFLQRAALDHFALGRRAGDAARLLKGDVRVHTGSAPPFMSDTSFVPAGARPQMILTYDISVYGTGLPSRVREAGNALDTISYGLATEIAERAGANVFDFALVLNLVTTNRIGNCRVGIASTRGGFFVPDSTFARIIILDPPHPRNLIVECDTSWLDLSA
jgi:hypothetical protein